MEFGPKLATLASGLVVLAALPTFEVYERSQSLQDRCLHVAAQPKSPRSSMLNIAPDVTS
jgi:hypothetical protein